MATAALVAMLLSARGSDLGAGMAGSTAAFTYPSGFLVGGPLLFVLLGVGMSKLFFDSVPG